jgi:cation diffusion facilitator family transporter
MRPTGTAGGTSGGRKERAERWAITGALALALLKLGVGLLTGSIGLVSAAADSLMDVVVSSFNLFSIRLAASPADEGHPFGHGKAESLAGLAQSAVIAGVGGWLLVEAARRLLRGARPEHAEWGMGVMVVATIASWLIARHLARVGRETDSVVLLADALHYATDVWTNGGVLLGLVLLRLTGSGAFDALIAIGVALVILGSAFQFLARSVRDLMDAALPAVEQRVIEEVIRRHTFVVGTRDLRTRRSGSQRQVDFTAVACRHLPLGDAHDLVDHVEKEIAEALPGAHVVVHAEPCVPGCQEIDRCALRARQPHLFAHDSPP